VFDHIAQSSSEYNNPDYYVKLSLGISSLGIFFIIIFLYKFTTLGTWIRYYLLKKKKINVKLDEDEQYLLDKYSDYPDKNNYIENLNISYNP
ncbi:PIR Superfamily Protein, partial [Plasmodium ovale curtisi]